MNRFGLYGLRQGFEVEKWGMCKISFRNREVSHPKTRPVLFPSFGDFCEMRQACDVLRKSAGVKLSLRKESVMVACGSRERVH